MNRDAAFHVNAEAELLRQCAASGQLSASQVHAHERAGELPAPSAERVRPCQVPYQCTHATICAGAPERCERARLDTLAGLQREIADEACRVDIECHALGVPSSYPHPVYDVSALEPDGISDPDICAADQQAIDRAVRYLDMRGLLVRPIAGQANYVSFGRV